MAATAMASPCPAKTASPPHEVTPSMIRARCLVVENTCRGVLLIIREGKRISYPRQSNDDDSVEPLPFHALKRSWSAVHAASLDRAPHGAIHTALAAPTMPACHPRYALQRSTPV
jgi:hypothetical protein